jgi:hypothetical protein
VVVDVLVDIGPSDDLARVVDALGGAGQPTAERAEVEEEKLSR